MSKMVNSDNICNELIEKMNDSTTKKIDREFYNHFVKARKNGVKLTHHDLTKKVLIRLVVDELCSDSEIARLFSIQEYVVTALRNLYNLQDCDVLMNHTIRKTARLLKEIEAKQG